VHLKIVKVSPEDRFHHVYNNKSAENKKKQEAHHDDSERELFNDDIVHILQNNNNTFESGGQGVAQGWSKLLALLVLLTVIYPIDLPLYLLRNFVKQCVI